MAIYVTNIETGELVSYCPDDTDPVADAATLAANGLKATTGNPPLPSPAPSNTVDTSEWLMRFTPSEFIAITNSNDAFVKQLLFCLEHTSTINLENMMVQQGVNYLASINLITSDRVSELLS